MDRRKFLAGSVAAGAATLAATSHARSVESSGSQEPAAATSRTQPARGRLQYPLTKEEKANGTVVHDLTFPASDARRYTPVREIDERAAMAENFDSMPD